MAVEVVDGGADGEDAVQDAADPDELLGEGSRCEEEAPAAGEGDAQDEGEEHDGVGVEREGVAGVVYSASTQTLVGSVALKRDTGNGDEAAEDEDQLLEFKSDRGLHAMQSLCTHQDTSPQIIPLRLLDLERLLKGLLLIVRLAPIELLTIVRRLLGVFGLLAMAVAVAEAVLLVAIVVVLRRRILWLLILGLLLLLILRLLGVLRLWIRLLVLLLLLLPTVVVTRGLPGHCACARTQRSHWTGYF